jgi:hypothetical protein
MEGLRPFLIGYGPEGLWFVSGFKPLSLDGVTLLLQPPFNRYSFL